MKRFSQALAVILTVSMIMSMACVLGFAAEPDCVIDKYASLKKGYGYLYIGDSYARGYAATVSGNNIEDESQNIDIEYKDDQYFYDVNEVGSVPYYVAQKIGLISGPIDNSVISEDARFWPWAYNALSTEAVLAMLGKSQKVFKDYDLYQDERLKERYERMYAFYGNSKSYKPVSNDPWESSVDGTKKPKGCDIDTILNNAGLITVQLGMSDVVFRVKAEAERDLDYIKNSLDNPQELVAEVTKLVGLTEEYYNAWKDSYKTLMDCLKEAKRNNTNKSSKIVLVGILNPIENVMITDDILLPLGSILNVITDRMNSYIKQCAEKNGFIYVDISNVDTPSTTKHMSVNTIMAMLEDPDSGDQLAIVTHPTKAGYEQIGRMIMTALDEKLDREAALIKPVSPDPNIKVDIGTDYEKVHYVKLDGKTVSPKYYRTKNHLLSITCNRTNAKKLEIAIGRLEPNETTGKKDLKITTMSYTLKWSAKSGYTIRRVYVTTDTVATVKKTIQTVRDAISVVVEKLGTAIKNLFTK